MKIANKLFLFASSFMLALTLGACSNKLPTTNYEKVKYAFNGVEKSFKKIKTTSKGLIQNNRNKINPNNDALNTIFSVYTDNDIRDDFEDDVSYNEPPMIQFQYVKKVLEKVGNGYEFDTKYSDTITGDVYIDIETGQISDKEKDKFNYTFGLTIDINIDSNNLITADVSFDIKLNRNSEEYKTKWYVGIELDYDMNNSIPNYTMSMVTENDESELLYYKHYTYEYDYVEVRDSAINEWRKFCNNSSSKLVIDDEHPSFDSYKDSIFRIEPLSWFKDGRYYKTSTDRGLTGENVTKVAKALFEGVGLNSNNINAEAYFNKPSVPNKVLTTCYNDFCKIYKKDIIYSLLEKEDYGGGQQNNKESAIRAMNDDLSGGAGGYSVDDITFWELFRGFIDSYGEKHALHLYYIDQNGGLMYEVPEISRLYFTLKDKDDNLIVPVNLEDNISDGLKALVLSGQTMFSRTLTIMFKDEEKFVEGSMDFYYAGDLPSNYVAPVFPEGLTAIGLPKYETEIATEFIYKADAEYEGGKKHLTIKGTNYDEAESYVRALKKAGFNESDDLPPSGDEHHFIKYNSDTQIVYVTFKFGKSYSDYELTAWEAIKEQQDDNKITAISIVGDFNNWSLTENCIEFSLFGEVEFVLENIIFSAGDKFKIVVNHTWDIHGGFGYSDIEDMRPELFESEGKEDNIVVKQTCMVEFRCDAIDKNNIHIRIFDAQPVNR